MYHMLLFMSLSVLVICFSFRLRIYLSDLAFNLHALAFYGALVLALFGSDCGSVSALG